MIETKGTWAFVTGASRGIGKQIALSLGALGCNLVLQSRNIAHFDKIKKELEKYQIQIKYIAAELSDQSQVHQLLTEVDQMEIEIDIVYNVAGVYTNIVDYYHFSMEDFKTLLSVNVIADTEICNHFIPKMIQRKKGRIVNITGRVANEPEVMGYATTKAAMNRMTYELGATVNGTNVMINLADPGWVRTDLGTINAPHDVASCIPGVLLPAFLEDQKSGRIFLAEKYYGMSLQEALAVADERAILPNYPLAAEISCNEKEWFKFLKAEGKKYIFGTGNTGKFCRDQLLQFGIQIDGFIVSKAEKRTIDGVPVFETDELIGSNCVILIAVKEATIPIIYHMLKEKGFEDIYTTNEWKWMEKGASKSKYRQWRTW